jgi:hypothetical protein
VYVMTEASFASEVETLIVEEYKREICIEKPCQLIVPNMFSVSRKQKV